MRPSDRAFASSGNAIAFAALVFAAGLALSPRAEAQTTGVFTRAVGGIDLGVDGMVANATRDTFGELRRLRLEAMEAIPDGLKRPTDTRRISLRQLNDAIREAAQGAKPLPVEMQCLGGLTQIHYVLVYPEQNDIVLVGPAEGWKVDERGTIVGDVTGRPVILLDDLLTALRSANAPVRSVISCSIDPTPEGLQRVGVRTRFPTPQAQAAGLEQRLGPQVVSVTGVPETSHYARVLVGADYRMKRIGLGIEPAPIRELPSFLQLMRGNRGSTMPRWWLAPNYEPLLRDAEGLAWELRGAAVKAMAETEFLSAAGRREQSGRANPAFEKWAELMTEHYERLAAADPVFGQLRNCMDLAIVAAVMAQENLPQKAQVRLPMLMDQSGPQTAVLPAPKQVPSKSTLAKKGSNWIIACGGVQINAWAMVGKAERTDSLASVRRQLAGDRQPERWWD